MRMPLKKSHIARHDFLKLWETFDIIMSTIVYCFQFADLVEQYYLTWHFMHKQV